MSGNSETKRYLQYFTMKKSEWENLCIRCGACCGAYDDPCEHLVEIEKDKFFCHIYNERFGDRKTVSGDEFECVPVKEIIHVHWKKDYLCACKKYLRSCSLFSVK